MAQLLAPTSGANLCRQPMLPPGPRTSEPRPGGTRELIKYDEGIASIIAMLMGMQMKDMNSMMLSQEPIPLAPSATNLLLNSLNEFILMKISSKLVNKENSGASGNTGEK